MGTSPNQARSLEDVGPYFTSACSLSHHITLAVWVARTTSLYLDQVRTAPQLALQYPELTWLLCLTGEKIVPVPQENHIVSSPFAAGAVMFGWGKHQPGVLIEPSVDYAFDPDNEAELVKYRNLIWYA